CRNNGTFEELSAKGIPLGIMPDANFESCETHIEVGDRLFLYTDGVTEAEDLYMELYGKERLLTILSKYNDKSSIDTLNAIKSSLGQYTRGLESSDDITMISLRRES
ncbi:MAG: PP2C family protein-serine/threonine phosphatase, partial [bacterium]|nr:PP2C family protein-serine/threonine phosphatase [bacterium]